MDGAIVTGASGFIGSAVVRALAKKNIRVAAIDKTDCLDELACLKTVKTYALDLSEPITEAGHLRGYEAFYHFAWAGAAGETRLDYGIQIDNVTMTSACVELAANLGCKRFIGAGSIMEKEVVAISSKPEPGHIYSSAKLAAHYISKCTASKMGIDYVWGIITNAYGEGEKSARLINTTLRKIINSEPLDFTAATQNYDFVHIDDIADAFVLLGEKGRSYTEYVIGSGGAKPLKEFIIELVQAVAPEHEPSFGSIAFTGKSLPLETFDISTIKNDTGFTPKVSFKSGIQRTFKWIKDNG